MFDEIGDINKLDHELQILRSLSDFNRKLSSHYIVNCLHRNLISSSDSTFPILTSDVSIGQKLSSPFPFHGLVLESGGINLREFLDKRTFSLDSHTKRQILTDVTSAVEFIHNHGIVHMKLKPENIVSFAYSREGITRWKLVDFGSSFNLRSNPTSTLTQSDNISLNPEYLAPEIVPFLKG